MILIIVMNRMRGGNKPKRVFKPVHAFINLSNNEPNRKVPHVFVNLSDNNVVSRNVSENIKRNQKPLHSPHRAAISYVPEAMTAAITKSVNSTPSSIVRMSKPNIRRVHSGQTINSQKAGQTRRKRKNKSYKSRR
jgi:hypothetical protein